MVPQKKFLSEPILHSMSVQVSSELYLAVSSLNLYSETAAFDDILNYKLMDCWATPTNNPDDTTKFDLSSGGCPTEDWIELKNASCISFPLFGFASATEDNLYVHCEIYICTEDSDECETSTCPASGGGRKRRHADAKTTMVSL